LVRQIRLSIFSRIYVVAKLAYFPGGRVVVDMWQNHPELELGDQFVAEVCYGVEYCQEVVRYDKEGEYNRDLDGY
jgi:hypothetical protein